MGCHERGVALVNVVVLLTLLLALAQILAEKVWQSSRQAAGAVGREQAFWAAQAGIEGARHRLTSEYRSSAGWQGLLANGLAGRYASSPAWSTMNNGLPVEIFLRDNPDGDNDPRADNDLKIFVLARARGPHGAEALVESLCGLEPAANSAGYPQAGGTGGPATEASDPTLLPVSTYAMKP